MQRYKISIEYDGTNLLGWQKQLDGYTVQGQIETAVKKFAFSKKPNEEELKESFAIHGAGRTDAGVHAICQTAHFDLDTDLSEYRIQEAINAHLKLQKTNIIVFKIEKVADDFDARFSATKRSYIYRILNRQSPSPLRKNLTWHVNEKLDIEKMREASFCLLGEHDFSSFRAAACQAHSPVKIINKIDIIKTEDEIKIYFEAPSFLHHQIRNIVGTIKMVGDGRLSPEDFKKILEAKDRNKAGPTAPASGLFMNHVWY